MSPRVGPGVGMNLASFILGYLTAPAPGRTRSLVSLTFLTPLTPVVLHISVVSYPNKS